MESNPTKTPLIYLSTNEAAYLIISYHIPFNLLKYLVFTDFENLSVDSTFLKASNNKFNVIHKDDVKTLPAYYLGHRISNKQLTRLKFPDRRFLNREDLSNLKKK